jgi:TP901 family phage tail tape measure protein
MARSSIRGITIKVGGDTTELQRALRGVNGEARNLQSEMNQVKRLMKLDPSSTVLMAQKQKVLNEAIGNTKAKLEQLKDAQGQVDAEFKNGDIGEEQYRAFQREIEQTEQKLKSLEKAARESGGTVGQSIQETGKKMQSTGQKISDVGQKLMPVSATVAGIGVASAKTAADFETSMSQTAGALDIPMSKMGNLRALALKMGADTQFSAEQAGQAMTELAKGGLTEADIEGGALKSTMDLAASSSMDLGTAANTVVQVMGAFGLTAKDSAQAVNALAGAAAASSTDVEPLSQGLSQCGAQAHTAGWSIQQTTAVLGAFADAGIVGSDAGTSLKTMLQRLGAPTDKAATEMKSLGLNVWTSNGHMKDASGIAQELQNKLGKLSDKQKQQALATIFGSDATRAATVLMNDGASGLSKYVKATNDQTSAQRLANSQMGNSAKTWEQMKGSIETAAIQIGNALLPTINKVVDAITNLTNKFSALSPTTQDMIIKIGMIVAALAPLLIGFGKIHSGVGTLVEDVGKVVSHISTFTTALKGGTSAMGALRLAISPTTLAIAGIAAAVAVAIVGITKLVKYMQSSSIETQKLGSNVSDSTKKAMDSFNQLDQSADKSLKEISITGKKVTKQMASDMKQNIDGMATQTIDALKKQRDNSIKIIEETGTKGSGLTKKEMSTMVANVNNGYRTRITSEKASQKQIDTIMNNAAKQHRTLTKKETDEISKIKSKMYKNGVQALSKNQTEEQAIFDNMRVNHTATSAKEAAAIVKDSKTTTDKVIGDANNKYKSTVEAIEHERDDTHTISSDQADKLIKAAKKTRDNSVKAAQDQHSKVVTEAKKQAGEQVNQVDWTNGQVKDKWQVFRDNWNSFWSGWTGAASRDWDSFKWKTISDWDYLKNSVIIKWNDIKRGWNSFWSNFQSGAESGWRDFKSRWDSFWGTIGDVFKKLNPFSWGKDLIDNIAKGINAGKNSVTSAVGWVADKIKSVLHHSHPDEGALKDDYTWMPDMMEGFAKGISDNRYLVSNAIQDLTSDFSAIPTDATMSINAGINAFNGLGSLQQVPQVNNTTQVKQPININLNINQGDIVVKGNANTDTIRKIKAALNQQTDKIANTNTVEKTLKAMKTMRLGTGIVKPIFNV